MKNIFIARIPGFKNTSPIKVKTSINEKIPTTTMAMPTAKLIALAIFKILKPNIVV